MERNRSISLNPIIPKGGIKRLNFGLIGAGKVGTFFASLLERNGFKVVAISDKDQKKARRCYRRLGRKYQYFSNYDVAHLSDVLLCATPDDVIVKVYNEVKRYLKPNAFFCHFSGSISQHQFLSDALVLSIHPMYPFAERDIERIIRLSPKDCPFALEGNKKALKLGERLIKTIGGRYIIIPSEEKELYHLVCIFAANFLWANMKVAFNLGKDLIKKRDFLLPLATRSLYNIFRYKLEEAITGPITRGDKTTLQRHINLLQKKFPQYLPLYQNLSWVIFDAVKDRLNPEDREEIERLITGGVAK